MGRLIEFEQFSKPLTRSSVSDSSFNAFWFFADPKYPTLEHSFPHMLSIHRDQIEGGRYDEPSPAFAGATRIEIRKFIERDLENDVVYTQINLIHVRVPPLYKGKRYPDTKPHGYYRFHFEAENDAFHFKMRFGELIKPETPYHPSYPPQEGHDDFFGSTAHMRARDLSGYHTFW